MTHSEKSVRTEAPVTWRARLRKPAIMTAAGVLGLGLIGTTLVPESGPKFGTSAAVAQTMPNGAAPISFSVLAKKVKPAVISIHVKNGAKRRCRSNVNWLDPDNGLRPVMSTAPL